MIWRVKLIQINRHTGRIQERVLQRHYASQQDAHRTAQQLCASAPRIISQAIAYLPTGN